MNIFRPTDHDALLIVDVQNDFLHGGKLAVPEGNQVIPALNRYIALFERQHLPVYATRDWHPADHCSFKAQGGVCPPHCIADSPGAQFAGDLELPAATIVVSKASTREKDAYSGFEGTDLARRLHSQGIRRLFVGGLATDYCVLNTVSDALLLGFEVVLLLDAIRAVNLQPDDGETAIEEMIRCGAQALRFRDIEANHSGLRPRSLSRYSEREPSRC